MKRHSSFICLLLLAFGERLIAQERHFPTRNLSSYTLFMEMSQSKSFIEGHVYTQKTRSPLGQSVISLGCKKVYADSLGYFHFELNREEEELYLTCYSVGYRRVETMDIQTSKRRVVLNFYLMEDDRPIVECPEIPSH